MMLIKPSGICKFCNSSSLHEFQAQERMLGLGGKFIYQECRNCGSLQLSNIPKDLSTYYPKDYYSFSPLVKSSPLKNLIKKVRMKLFLSGVAGLAPSYGYWLNRLEPNLKDKIADVGCGNGQLIYELHVGGFKNLHGFDPFAEGDAMLAENCYLWKKELSEADYSFDIIMMHHSFEHMSDPKQVLTDCYNHLNPGGKLLVRTPISDAKVFQEEMELWVQLDAPRHLVIPSIKGFRSVAEEIGFDLKEVVFDSEAFQFLGTELYKKGYPLSPENLDKYFTPEEQMEYKEKALLYNEKGLGDQVCFYLVKKD